MPPSELSKQPGSASELCSIASHHRTAPTTSETQDMLPPKWKMRLTRQRQMIQAEERRRLFEDETGRNFGQHVGETSLSFESFAERRRRERFLEPQQYPAGDVYAAGGAERQREVAGRRPQECAEM